MDKKKFKELVEKSNFEDLFKELSEAIKASPQEKDFEDQLSQLKASLTEISKQKVKGLLTQEEEVVAYAKVRDRFIELIDQLFNRDITLPKFFFNRPWLLPLMIFILLIGIAFTKLPTVNFEMEFQTPYIAFELLESWNIQEDLYLAQFSTNSLKAALIDTLSFQGPINEELGKINIFEGKIKWEEMSLKAQTDLSLSISEGLIQSNLGVQKLETLFDLSKAKIRLPGYTTSILAGNDTTFVSTLLTLGKNPRLYFSPQQDSTFTFEAIEITNINLHRNNLEDNRELITEISPGSKVTIENNLFTFDYSPFIKIDDPSYLLLSLSNRHDQFSIRLSGSAKDITIGRSPEHRKSIKPTFLNYLSNNDQVNQFWIFVFGIASLLGLLSPFIIIWLGKK